MWWPWLDNLARDLRFAVRSLRGTPGFTVAAISSLALGLSLTAVTVAAVNAYLIRSLPYAAGERLYRVRYAPPGPWEPRGMSALDWRSIADVVEFPITSASETFYLSDREFSQSARGLRVSRGFVEGLGIRPILGRSLDETDFTGAGAQRNVLIGHALWRERYGTDPGIVGRLISVDAEGAEGSDGGSDTFRIAGVLPRDFYFGRDSRDLVDLLVPLTSQVRTYMVRLRPGVPAPLAEERITEAARQVASGLPADWTGVHLESVRELYVGELRSPLVGVTVACGLVLLIVCANVAVLMLLRTTRRQKDLAVRAALGCGRWHLARMLLIEAALVCAGAAAIALALTAISLEALAPMIESQLGRPAPGGASAMAIDSTVLLIVGAAGFAIALTISWLPLLTPWQRRLADALRRESPAGGGRRALRHIRSTLIALQIAGTLVLLVGCGLTLRSVIGMLRTDLGFEPARLVRSRVVLRGADYGDRAAFARFYREFTDRLGAAIDAPVVFTNWPPFFELPIQVVESSGRLEGLNAGAMSVGAGYFETFGIALRSGRDFTTADASAAEPVAVISESLARRLWSESSPLGRRVRAIEPTPDGNRAGPWRTVVGVAADVRQTYADPQLSDIYVPLSPAGRFGSFYIRTNRPPSALLAPVLAVAAEIDPHAMLDPPRSVEGENTQLARTQFLASLLSGFAVIAAFLAVLGIYGVTAYAVQQREREIAIRMAIGASRSAVMWLCLRGAGLVLIAGLCLGLLGAAAAARMIEHELYAVGALDSGTLAATCLLLGAAGVFASWLPARRAARRHPLVVLKEG